MGVSLIPIPVGLWPFFSLPRYLKCASASTGPFMGLFSFLRELALSQNTSSGYSSGTCVLQFIWDMPYWACMGGTFCTDLTT